MSRPTRDETMMAIAREMAKRTTCARRGVGAVAVDVLGRVLSTGHNGVPMGMTHCTDMQCGGTKFRSGEGLNVCQATHAEINALIFCPDVSKIDTFYVTASPCTQCMRALMNTSTKRLVYAEVYDQQTLDIWRLHGREAYHLRCDDDGRRAETAAGLGRAGADPGRAEGGSP